MKLRVKNFLLNIYITLSFVNGYDFKFRKQILLVLVALSFLVLLVYHKNFFKKNKKDIYTLGIFILLLLSLIFNIELHNFTYTFVNISVLLACMLIAKEKYEKVINIIKKNLIFFNYINLILLNFFHVTSSNAKKIFGYTIIRRRTDWINLSIVSIWALLLLIYSIWNIKENHKRTMYDYINIVISFVLIFLSGKVNVFIAIMTISLIAFYRKISNKSNFLIISLQLFFINTSWLFLSLKKIVGKFIDVPFILTGRDRLWLDYYTYMFENPFKIIFGFNFLQEEVSYINHPHNQYLMIFYILGIFGIILYSLLFYRVLKNTNKKNKLLFNLNIGILILMTGDDYFVLTVMPLYYLIIMCGLYYEKKERGESERKQLSNNYR
ncbi:O-antigen ligase family protein [Fusobacterium canifelinum]|uniref:O-antigen ligase family protein n=1 Tax=Fusobacterium canifelinum TaxID=285729 RepID=A0ABX7CL24_9FUSO|nr:O-antigen ligase family protein [Fusobacterium canifelinum]QQS88004.1 O-antigen ligase family protein [Fusobacterium canifelinum]